ncbi:MAG: isoleucine--tRNA ligase [Firmicutes bacterium]|jgi:isoleucyl-tRNA synthetase|nr:isoleucine--tRNA ligase [Bacillota bacterium]
MFKRVDASMDFPEMESRILDFWKENRVFENSVRQREGAPEFIFYEGPPTANGLPHPGHVLTRAIKDVVLRYKTMTGYQVRRKGGWDTHGLPVELEVEKQLGISGKPDIERYGVEAFVRKCKESVFVYEQEWRRMTERLGFWIDMDDPYVTYHDSYIESVWWAVKTIWEKGLMYRGHKVVPYCPRCGTALSSHEVAQGYRDVTEPSVYVRFRVPGSENLSFLVWTTTPWTLPSNVALAVSPEFEYAYVAVGRETLILARDLVETRVHGPYEVTKVVRGSDLAGMTYEPLYQFAEVDRPAYRVVTGDFVTLTEGTGIVHIAPAFGEDDMRVGRENDLPVVQLVDTQGRFDPRVGPWAGTFVKEADPLITQDLKARGLLFEEVDYTHSYPFCWRCDTPLLYYARSSWFIRMSELRDRLLANNNAINWYPGHIREGRFGNFLENVIDWAVSRERYWGTPMPIWVCGECGHEHAVGGVDELKKMARVLPAHLELHRPYIDEAVLSCPKCGADAKRVPEVMDCWFDSGSMPFAQWHYPFENEDVFAKSFPADFITEAVDQTRGWFYTLLAVSTCLFDRSPFENCVVLGLVLDENGLKMSKSKGNVVDIWKIFGNQGADAMRWYLYTVNAPWSPTRFSAEGITEVMRKFLGTLWNVYAFYVLYANIDGFDPKAHSVPVAQRAEIDRWIISRLNGLISDVRSLMDRYDVTAAGRKIEEFVDDLSNWYVRRSRRRYWGGEMTRDKEAAYLTLQEALVTVARLLAPFTPFVADEIWRNLEQTDVSVHLTDYPQADEDARDTDLERRMALARDVVYLGRAARNAVKIKNRQPLPGIVVQVVSAQDEQDLASLSGLVLEELNIKSMSFARNLSSYVSYKVKPRFDLLGPKHGKKMRDIASALAEAEPEAVGRAVAGGDSFPLKLSDGSEVVIEAAEVTVETHAAEGYHVETEGDRAIALATTVSDELLMEGFARELVNKIQTMRKEAQFQIEDRILTTLSGGENSMRAAELHKGYLMDETLSLDLVLGEPQGDHVQEWDVNGEKVTIGVRKAG